MNFLSLIPLWKLLISLLAGLAYGFLFYYRSSFTREKKITSFPVNLLFGLRVLTVTIIVLLFFNPVFRKFRSNEEKPIVVFAQDNSQSIILNKDSLFYKNEYPDLINKLVKSLEKKFKVVRLSFDQQVHDGIDFSFNGSETNFQRLFNAINSRFYKQNLGAVIVASDGNYNSGSSPSVASQQLSCPIMSIALGDSSLQTDIAITDLEHNLFAYKGNNFPVTVSFSAHGLKGETARVSLLGGGKIIRKKTVSIKKNEFQQKVKFEVPAEETGIKNYQVVIDPLKNEASIKNNERYFYLEVLEKRKQIYMLSAAPHPDLSALERVLADNDDYTVKLNYTYNGSITSIPENTDLLVLYQLPSNDYPVKKIIENAEKNGTSILFVVGSKTSIKYLNQSQQSVFLEQTKKRMNVVEPILNEQFKGFETSPLKPGVIGSWSPLWSPFAKYNTHASNEILLKQKIGNVVSDMPLWMLSTDVDRKTGFIFGEGFFKWPLLEYKTSRQQNVFSYLVEKTVQELCLPANKSNFRLIDFRNTFSQNDDIKLKVVVLDKTLNKLNEATVAARFKNKKGNEFNFTFTEENEAYVLNAGKLPEGAYSFDLSTKNYGKTQRIKGEFVVLKAEKEFFDVQADYMQMEELCSKNRKNFFIPDEIQNIYNRIEALKLKPMLHFEESQKGLIDYILPFILLMLFLSVEWGLRKYFGKY